MPYSYFDKPLYTGYVWIVITTPHVKKHAEIKFFSVIKSAFLFCRMQQPVLYLLTRKPRNSNWKNAPVTLQ